MTFTIDLNIDFDRLCPTSQNILYLFTTNLTPQHAHTHKQMHTYSTFVNTLVISVFDINVLTTIISRPTYLILPLSICYK